VPSFRATFAEDLASHPLVGVDVVDRLRQGV